MKDIVFWGCWVWGLRFNFQTFFYKCKSRLETSNKYRQLYSIWSFVHITSTYNMPYLYMYIYIYQCVYVIQTTKTIRSWLMGQRFGIYDLLECIQARDVFIYVTTALLVASHGFKKVHTNTRHQIEWIN